MDLDEQLALTWGSVTHDPLPVETLRTRIAAQRRRRILQRGLEVVLTLVALIVFGLALLDAKMTPVHWLLLPFYAVFLPVAWTLALRAPAHPASDSAENVRTFARLRMAQLRANLREIHIARRAAVALLLYSVVASGIAVWLGGADWYLDAGWLLAVSVLWALGTHVTTRRIHRRRLREYRAMRRLLG